MYTKIKYIGDRFISGTVLVMISPLLVLIACIIYLQDKQGVFFLQKRVGLKGKEFQIVKFRTMIPNARLVGEYFTSDGDTRITPAGKWIRKLSLDELPQLWNVFKGEMAIVGPRPDVLEQKKIYSTAEWEERCSVRPGITGLAQVKGRSECTLEARKFFDLAYVKDMSFSLDLKIILMTIKQVLTKGGN